MAVREIARRLIDGVWQTVDAEENGGGASAASILGPFTIDWDDPGVTGYPGIAIAAVAEGTWVLDIWIQVIDQFIGDTSARVDFGISSDGPQGADLVGGWNVQAVGEEATVGASDFAYRTQAATGADEKLTASRTGDGTIRTVPARALVDCNLCAWALPDTGALTQGQAVIWMLVYVP